jgi:hypothetical protein
MDDIGNMTPREGLAFMLAAYEGKPHWVGYPGILRKAIDALDRAEASERKAVERAVALTFAALDLQAALDRAEADKAAAVEAMREAAIAACLTQKTKFADATKSDWERGNDSGALGCTYAIRALPARQRL